ncbi:BirA family transcriptional regulator, biotin operon repressor / biotin-[acetyl-CoA-carboxylase] ligase [Alkalibacterium subtropicum]|uniref:BirA family transcriptional regulator, biotin operon repressor / biotin-[acetyl-CoA-carboxylase] ligase n=1 Tax=Alkalibacterium subtropicum TaxID=753702 RepID=A0A1I1EPT1_9LACT|nr:biotin--[acetyl-CoA-carboxylase] ligase [Alkalibacterium subtropicum]SFB86940.1 BirA family transcriptional regulator, biotin operon repressor / biotin-[acetyl-CoA-carboxylase] ligase [Alkalibacterium subtropicum]
MTFKQNIIDALTIAYPKTLTFENLARALMVDQAHVVQAVNELQQKNFPISAQGNVIHLAYPLLSVPAISKLLDTDFIGKPVQLHARLDSTNTYAKANLSDLKNGDVILAHEQTAGKGRLGRNWTSPAGASISMSLVLKPASPFERLSLLTQLTAAALIKALNDWGDVKIKWPNDIILNSRKIAGILIETEFSGSSLEGIIIGIGINTNVDQENIPQELQSKATSLKEGTNREIDPNTLVASFLTFFEKYYVDFLNSQRPAPFLSVCREQSILIGKNYWIIDTDRKRKAYIKTIDSTGGLVVTYLDTNKTEVITSTDLSIRGDDHYV